MAKSTKSKVEDKEIKEVENTSKTEQKSEVEIMKAQMEAYKQQMEEMKKAMEEMMKNSAQPVSNQVIIKENEQEVEMGTAMVQGIGFTSRDGSVAISIPYGAPQSLPLSELKKLLRQPEVRKTFEDGICYFINPEDYALLGIYNHNDLSEEALEKILSEKDVRIIIRKFKELTQDMKNSSVTNCIIYRICDMIKDKKLNDMDYITRKTLEDYFGLPFERGIKTLVELEQLKG